jgi:site-specific DNA-methyltransferase (adenine-specific)
VSWGGQSRKTFLGEQACAFFYQNKDLVAVVPYFPGRHSGALKNFKMAIDLQQSRNKMLRMENDYLTTAEAAAYLGVSQARVRRLIRENRLPAEKRGRDLVLRGADLDAFALFGRKPVGRPQKECAPLFRLEDSAKPVYEVDCRSVAIGHGEIVCGDALKVLDTFASNRFQLIIADPPYFRVLLEHDWDNTWKSPEDYLEWTLQWVRACKRVLRDDGLLYIFGQLGKREHVWLHTCSMLAHEMQFHDMLIWDRAVGYNERYDSFTPQYEMVLVLRKTAESRPYFDKDAVRLPYDEETIRLYMRDKRYKDKAAREAHLRKGKYATNIIRVPSLKGASKEKIGHPSQKPIALINQLVASSSRRGDWVLDPFLGSGSTAASCEALGRRWIGIESNPAFVEMARRRIEAMLANPELPLT